jgi:hypothetical protein
MMVRKVTVAKLRVESPQVARARLKRVAGFLIEEARRQPAILGETAAELLWAGKCLQAFMTGRATSLERAFGLVGRRGNPGKTRKWSRLAAEIDAARLSTKQAADRLGLDDRNVRRGRQRGRIENERAQMPRIVSRLSKRLNKALKDERADRIATVNHLNRNHHIKAGK